jgi:hypothetical protein
MEFPKDADMKPPGGVICPFGGFLFFEKLNKKEE